MEATGLAHRARRGALDWAAPLAILVFGVVDVASHPHTRAFPGSPARHVVLLAVAVTALGLRRRAPVVAPALALVVATWWSELWPAHQQGPFEGFLVLVGASYCFGTAPDRTRLRLGAGVLVAWFLLGIVAGVVGGRLGDLVPIAVWLTVAFAVGFLISRRTEQARRATEAARIIAAEQERETARAVEAERTRIARELHDVVAHALSVIVVQAGVERRSLRAAASPDVAALDSALGSIEGAGRDALDDLRRLLGLLRSAGDAPSLSPQPGLAQLGDLVQTARDAGLAVEVDAGDTPPLPAGLDLTAYRIVQESLTNVIKHAGAARVRVAVAVQRSTLDVRVDNDIASGAVSATIPGAGHGLIGMRERAKVFGGTLTAGRGETGGWTVHARLPIGVRGE